MENSLSHSSTSAPGSAHPASDTSQEYLAFRVGHEEYGVSILKVQEIRGYDTVTAIANAPEFIKGVVNLRGTIVPIIDMRLAFNLEEPRYDQFTVVIIVNIGKQVVGMVVDGVSDVVLLSPDQVKPTPEMGAALNADYLAGLGTFEQRMLILLNINALMSDLLQGIQTTNSYH